MKHGHLFDTFSRWTGRVTSQPAAFLLAVAVILVWAVTGPLFGFSDTWQLVINTGTTIVTFLMVFLIQNTQTRDTEAMHLKLDEIIRSLKGANNVLLDLEDETSDDLDEIKARYREVAEAAKEAGEEGVALGRSTIGPPARDADTHGSKSKPAGAARTRPSRKKDRAA